MKENLLQRKTSNFRSTHVVTLDRSTHRLDMTTIFDEILAACPTHIRDEALLPFNQIEKYLILADYDRLFHSILSFLHSNESNGSLLRFSTHICLFLYEQNHSENFHEKNFIEILTTYIHHLIELEFKDLVCYYISKLPVASQCMNFENFEERFSFLRFYSEYHGDISGCSIQSRG